MSKLLFLRAAARAENKKQEIESINYFGKKATLEEKEKYIASWIYTKSLNKQYKINKANTEKQKTKVLKDLIKDYYKNELSKHINKVVEAENIINNKVVIKSIDINIYWSRNRTRGMNPHVTIDIITSDYNYSEYDLTGSASGCGYDKRSAATAEAFNKSKILKAYLYKAKNKALKNKTKLNYGSGYGAIPYFEGGVGFSCHERILKNDLGLKETYCRTTDKGNDNYRFENIKNK